MSAESRPGRVFDAALTAATQSRARSGRGKESTRREYQREWAKYDAWCRPPAIDGRRERWLNPDTDTTPAILAEYAEALCAAGVAPGTSRKAMAAIRSTLRSRGLAVPDGVPALIVLRDHEDTLNELGAGAKHAEPLLLDGMVAMLTGCDMHTRAGRRDAAMLHLMFAGLRLAEVGDLGLGQVHAVAEPAPGVVRVDVPGRDTAVVLRHWRSTDGEHLPQLCPVETVLGWRDDLVAAGAVSGPYLRGVDASGRISGLDRGHAGPAPGERMKSDKIALVFTRALVRSGLEVAGLRVVPQSLRLGGAATRLAQGAPGISAFVDGGWAKTSRVVNTFLVAFTPAGVEGADGVVLPAGAGERGCADDD